LIGSHHGETEEAEKLGIEILEFITEKCNKYKKKDKLNFSVYATPAESVASRVYNKDIEEFGEEKFIEVFGKQNLKGFYTNSCHIPVDFTISFSKKAQLEAPLHKLSPAGAIFYAEFDSVPSPDVVEKVVSYISNTDIEYYGLNYSIVYCPTCLEKLRNGEITQQEYENKHRKS